MDVKKMAKIAGFKIPQQFMTGAILGVFAPILVWLVSFIPPLATFLGANVGVGTVLGTKVAGLLAGTFIALPDLLVVAIGGGLAVMIGTWVYNQKWSPNTAPGLRNAHGKLALILIYAALASTIILALPAFQLPLLATLLVTVVNAYITAWFAITVLGKQLKII